MHVGSEEAILMLKRIDVDAVPVIKGSRYPPPFDGPCAARARQRLGDAANLSDFGVNLPGSRRGCRMDTTC
jgi:uncharacterized cupin superfamily protein